MPKDKPRTIYAHEIKFYKFDSNAEDNQVEVSWKPKIIEDVFNNIIALTEPQRLMKDPNNEWVLYLDSVKVIKDDPVHKGDYMTGWFCSTKDGLRTTLFNMHTHVKEKNPKKPGQNEIRRTHFYIRLSDGLFLLDNYSDNVATNIRIEAYIANFAKKILDQQKIIRLSFEKLLSQGFIDKLNGFKVINIAQLRVKVQDNVAYDKSDALGQMQEDARVTKASQIDIIISRPRKRLEGMAPEQLSKLLRKYMNRTGIISGTIKGKPYPGNQPELKLSGAEEKYPKRFDTNSEGEVLTERVFESMLDLGNSRKKLTRM